jgi:chitin disaccharide deacetylase
VKRLIVNGDDFGASSGVNRGIIEAHERGILTSASLMVDLPGAEEAAELAQNRPELSVGLHVVLTREDGERTVPPGGAGEEIERQFERFCALRGRPPTHLDSHHNIHFEPEYEPVFLDAARRHSRPLRGYSDARYIRHFYGQWGDGSTHLELISVEGLIHVFKTEVGEGFNEIGCHPGYIDPGFKSSYSTEREAELRTLCAPAARAAAEQMAIRLVNFTSL